MHIIIATIQVPFVQGGAEVHARNLLEALRGAGHATEIVAIPFKWYPPERMLDSMLACRLLDLTEANGRSIDRVIGLKFPAYLLPHPNKVLWILHQHRQAYEQWEHPLSDMVHHGSGSEVRDAIREADTRLIPEARAVYTNSENVSRRLRKYNGLESTPLYHPPTNPEAFYCEEAEPYFFFPSRINAAKRQLLAVQALALVPARQSSFSAGRARMRRTIKAFLPRLKHHGYRSAFASMVESAKRKSSNFTRIASEWFIRPSMRTTVT